MARVSQAMVRGFCCDPIVWSHENKYSYQYSNFFRTTRCRITSPKCSVGIFLCYSIGLSARRSSRVGNLEHYGQHAGSAAIQPR